MRWGPAALWAHLAKDLVAAGLGTGREHGELFPYDAERLLLVRFDGERSQAWTPPIPGT